MNEVYKMPIKGGGTIFIPYMAEMTEKELQNELFDMKVKHMIKLERTIEYKYVETLIRKLKKPSQSLISN